MLILLTHCRFSPLNMQTQNVWRQNCKPLRPLRVYTFVCQSRLCDKNYTVFFGWLHSETSSETNPRKILKKNEIMMKSIAVLWNSIKLTKQTINGNGWFCPAPLCVGKSSFQTPCEFNVDVNLLGPAMDHFLFILSSCSVSYRIHYSTMALIINQLEIEISTWNGDSNPLPFGNTTFPIYWQRTQ